MMSRPASPDDIRASFARALSDMYQSEMPKYREMGALVSRINKAALRASEGGDAPEPQDIVQHGAIRIGMAQELSDVRRVFAVMGMAPVGYYNLSTAGIPVHSTAFRPIDADALQVNPFRVFTSLLRLDLIEDEDLRKEAAGQLAQRDILTPRCRALLDLVEREGGLDESLASKFVFEAVQTFRWRGEATTSVETYARLHAAHPLLADIVCFKGPHLNHLTLRTLDIDAAQRAMADAGMNPKPVIEGPPGRRCPILLRQTSFKAVPEIVRFSQPLLAQAPRHMARFGEIEQRGVALTQAGRALYDRLLAEVYKRAPPPASVAEAAAFEQELVRVFAAFPDDEASLHREKLAHYKFLPAADRASAAGLAPQASVEDLVAAGLVLRAPIAYEDFLPVSAAGIFRSNLSETQSRIAAGEEDRAGFEEALGARILESQRLYEEAERASLAQALRAMGLNGRAAALEP